MAVQFYHNVEPNNTGPRVKWLEVLLYRHLEGEELGEVFLFSLLTCQKQSAIHIILPLCQAGSAWDTRPASASKHLGPGKSINF